MRKNLFCRGLFLVPIITGITILSAIAKPELLLADSINEGVFPIDSKPYGVSYEDWTIKYWQWFLSIPADISPDTHDCGVEQGSLPVFFLAGGPGGVIERTCTVPPGKALLIPVVVVECSFAELSGSTEEELHTCAEEDQSSNPILFLSIDGREIQQLDKYRVHSRAFNVTFPENAVFGADPGPSRAVSDGHWLILEPLPPGKHEIHSKASLTNPKTGILFFSVDVSYHLTVEEAEKTSSIQLVGTSTSGNFFVETLWIPDDIGSENSFTIKLMDANGKELSGARYDVMLFKGEQHLNETHRSDQTVAEQKYFFDEVGSYTLRIENINGSGASDGISIPIQVTPEFDTIVVILLALGTAVAIVGGRQAGLTGTTKGS